MINDKAFTAPFHTLATYFLYIWHKM